MNPAETAAPQAAPQEPSDLNAPSARPQADPVPGREETPPDQNTSRTDAAPDPAAYPNLQLPEDVSFPEAALEDFKTLSQEMGLSEDQVQKLLDLEARFVRSGAQHGAEVAAHRKPLPRHFQLDGQVPADHSVPAGAAACPGARPRAVP